jgi:hypothetical protein
VTPMRLVRARRRSIVIPQLKKAGRSRHGPALGCIRGQECHEEALDLRELCLTPHTIQKLVTTGACRLCGEIRELQRSHFLPAAFYAMARKASPTGEPVVLMGTTMVMIDKEARTPLLCSGCEERFNQRGENWVIRHCWRSPTDFPLLDRLRVPEPFTLEPGFASFQASAITGIDLSQLVYFAASVSGEPASKSGDSATQRTSACSLGLTKKNCART